MNRQLKVSRKRINLLVKGFETVIKYIINTNRKLEKGIEKLHSTNDKMFEQARRMNEKVEANFTSIQEHEQEIVNNKKLMSKFEDFLGGNE